MTFLELCQKAAKESGTVTDFSQPATVLNQTGRLSHIIGWVQDAWRDIQTARSRWLWMQGEFEGATVAAQQRYSATDDFGLTRFDEWIFHPHDWMDSTITLYLTRDDEQPLRFLPWDTFYTVRLRGGAADDQNRPYEFSIDPALKLVLYPIPDAAYSVRGRYYKAPQELADDADVPEMPVRFHDLIWMKAVVSLAANDGRMDQYQIMQGRIVRLMNKLAIDQLPRVERAEPLA